MYRSFACSTIGADHIRRGVVCQDHATNFTDDIVSIAVVADGHGSSQYIRSEIGAEFATKSAVECVKTFVNEVNNSITTQRNLIEELDGYMQSDLIIGLEKSILIKWHEYVDKHFSENPFSEESIENLPEKYQKRYQSNNYIAAYGTTLIVTFATKDYWIVLHIGDGHCIVVDENLNISHPVADDPNCHEEVTTSICQVDAKDSFRYYYSKSKPYGIFVGTDGVDDSYDDNLMLYEVYKGIISVFEDDFEKGVDEISNFLPIITQKGKGDDTSISGIIDTSKMKFCANYFRKQISIKTNEMNG